MTMAKKIGSHLRTSLANAIKGQNMAIENTTIEKLREVDDPRDPKGRKWKPIEDQTKRERKWVDIEDLTKKKEPTWISMEVE